MIELEESRLSEAITSGGLERPRSTAFDAFHHSLWRHFESDNRFSPNNEEEWSSLILRYDSLSIGGSLVQKSHDWLFVSTIWVKPGFRHLGAGARLLRMIEAMARKEAAIGVYLATADMYAHDFYLGNGFEVTGTIKDNPSRGFTLFLMQKRLG